MACWRCNQDSGYGRVGGEGRGVETAAPEPETGGIRLRLRNAPYSSTEAATVSLLSARRSFLMVDGHSCF